MVFTGCVGVLGGSLGVFGGFWLKVLIYSGSKPEVSINFHLLCIFVLEF